MIINDNIKRKMYLIFRNSLKNIFSSSKDIINGNCSDSNSSILSNMASKFNIRAISIFVFVLGRREQITMVISAPYPIHLYP